MDSPGTAVTGPAQAPARVRRAPDPLAKEVRESALLLGLVLGLVLAVVGVLTGLSSLDLLGG